MPTYPLACLLPLCSGVVGEFVKGRKKQKEGGKEEKLLEREVHEQGSWTVALALRRSGMECSALLCSALLCSALHCARRVEINF